MQQRPHASSDRSDRTDGPARWDEFAAAEPDLARRVTERLRACPGYLATVDDRGAPRVHPVTPIVGDAHLFVFMEPTSPKGRDIARREWFALHNGVPDNDGTGGECHIRGRAWAVDDPALRETAVAAAAYAPADRYVLFELGLDAVMFVEYRDDRPVRRRWVNGRGDDAGHATSR